MKEFFLRVKGVLRSAWEFLVDTRKELKNVSWPMRAELMGTTIVVIVAVFFFGIFLFAVDIVVRTGMDYVFRQFTR